METFGSSIWVRLHSVAAVLWLGLAAFEIVNYPGSAEVQVKFAIVALVGAVIIMSIGLGIQFAINRVVEMSR